MHLYALCWNDEQMLPFFFRHYDQVVDQYFIFDDGSTDASLKILAEHPHVTVARNPRTVPGSFVLSARNLFNTCWKASRGRADWVIVTDIDEHLYHEHLGDYLARCASAGVTFVPALGFQMISEGPPSAGANLCLDYPMGAPWGQMMKASVFNPNAIEEMEYQPGRHRAAPSGQVLLPPVDELLLMHFKYLGFQHTRKRHRALSKRLGVIDRIHRFGHRYSWGEKRLRDDWDAFKERLMDTREFRHQPAPCYPLTPWWADFERVTELTKRAD